MPTKERRIRELERDKLNAVLSPNKKLLEMIPIERLGSVAPYVVNDMNGDPYLHPKVGKGGNDFRHTDRLDEVKKLQDEYKLIWHKRGAAKIISIEKNLSHSTIQKYIKNHPLK